LARVALPLTIGLSSKLSQHVYHLNTCPLVVHKELIQWGNWHPKGGCTW